MSSKEAYDARTTLLRRLVATYAQLSDSITREDCNYLTGIVASEEEVANAFWDLVESSVLLKNAQGLYTYNTKLEKLIKSL